MLGATLKEKLVVADWYILILWFVYLQWLMTIQSRWMWTVKRRIFLDLWIYCNIVYCVHMQIKNRDVCLHYVRLWSRKCLLLCSAGELVMWTIMPNFYLNMDKDILRKVCRQQSTGWSNAVILTAPSWILLSIIKIYLNIYTQILLFLNRNLI